MTDLPTYQSPGALNDLQEGKVWTRALLWFAGLVPFFFISYGLANLLAASKSDVGSITYQWEQSIPFLPWSIVPYWSIDLFYGAALFLCGSRQEVDTLAKRLLSVQVVAVACFILFPLTFSFDRPDVNGVPAQLFALLEGFDKPYNQAPSLHIALLVVLWVHYVKHVPDRLCKPMHVWFTAITVSVLTTYQHHFIDVPTGALLGLFCIWLLPDRSDHAFSNFRTTTSRRLRLLTAAYGMAATALIAIALYIGGAALWLAWPAISLLLVALAYAGLGETMFQKDAQGLIRLPVKLLLAPYLLGAWINSRLWTCTNPHPVHVADDVWIGRFPSVFDLRNGRFSTVVDMTAELSAPTHSVDWISNPNLDLIVPDASSLQRAASAIEDAQKFGPVLVCCALGYARSSHAVATWLVRTDRCEGIDDAIKLVSSRRPHFKPSTDSQIAIRDALQTA